MFFSLPKNFLFFVYVFFFVLLSNAMRGMRLPHGPFPLCFFFLFLWQPKVLAPVLCFLFQNSHSFWCSDFRSFYPLGLYQVLRLNSHKDLIRTTWFQRAQKAVNVLLDHSKHKALRPLWHCCADQPLVRINPLCGSIPCADQSLVRINPCADRSLVRIDPLCGSNQSTWCVEVFENHLRFVERTAFWHSMYGSLTGCEHFSFFPFALGYVISFSFWPSRKLLYSFQISTKYHRFMDWIMCCSFKVSFKWKNVQKMWRKFSRSMHDCVGFGV